MDLITAVPMHRIQPIYSALDNYTPKLALNLCNKALKKQPDALILIALKALSLMHLGEEEEAYKLCKVVETRGTQDEAILQAVCMVYELKRDNESIVALYDAAYKVNTRNEELANHWFMGLVRLGDYKKIQLAASQINSNFKTNRYRFWVIIAMWMQVVQKAPNSALLVQLVVKSLEKAASDGKIDSYEQIILYLNVLETSKNFDEITRILLSDTAKALIKVETERMAILAKNYIKSGSYADAFIALKDLCKLLPDDWETCYLLADAAVNMEEQNPGTVRLVDEFLNDLKEKSPSLRGPLLGRLELRRIAKVRSIEVPTPTSVDLIMEYYKLTGNKSCFFLDVTRFLDEDMTALPTALMEASCLSTSVESIQSIKDIIAMSNVERVTFHYNKDRKDEEFSISECKRLLKLYKHSLTFGTALDEREIQPADCFLILAVFHLLELFQRKNDISLIIEATSLLKYGIEKSKWNYRLKFMLIPIYIYMGALEPSISMFGTLDIKQIQFDPLSFILTDYIDFFPATHGAVGAIQLAEQIYNSNNIETPAMLVKAFQYSTLTRIPEFVRFQRRLDYSLQRAVHRSQRIRLDIIRRFSDINNVKEFITSACETYINGSTIPVSAETDVDKVLEKDFEMIDDLCNNTDKTVLPSPRGLTVQGLLFGTVKRERDSYLKSIGLLPLLLNVWFTKGDSKTISIAIQNELAKDTDVAGSFERDMLSLVLALDMIYAEHFREPTERADVDAISAKLVAQIDSVSKRLNETTIANPLVPTYLGFGRVQSFLEMTAFLKLFVVRFLSRKFASVVKRVAMLVEELEQHVSAMRNAVARAAPQSEYSCSGVVCRDAMQTAESVHEELAASWQTQFAALEAAVRRVKSAS